MKNIYKLLLIAFAVLAGVSCKGSLDPQEPAAKAAEVIGSYLKIPAKGGESFIYIKSAETVKADALKDWVSISTSRSNDTTTVVASALANESFESRYSQVLVKAGDQTFEFTVQQLGFQTSDFEPSDININSDAASFDFPYTYDEEMIADVDVDWITLTVTKDNLHIEIAENTTDATKDNTERVGIIEWSLGHDGGLITVTQKNASFMKQDSNWTVTYDGRHNDEDGQLADFITNTVAKAGVSGKYMLLYAPKDQVDEYGKMEDAVLDVLAPQAKEALDYIIALYEAILGETHTYDDFLNEDTYTDIFNPIAAGKYYAFAIGLDSEDCMATGHYNYCEFEVKGGDDPTGYSAWLGEWEVKRGSTTDTWKIEKKVEGSTYTVTGIEGQPFPVEAEYDAATSSFVLPVQEGVASTSTSYGTVSVGMYGQFVYEEDGEEYFVTGDYDIFTASMTSSTAAKMTPGKVKLEDIGEVTLSSFLFLGELLDGEYVGQYVTFSREVTDLPNTMTKKGGDDPTPPSPSTGYDAWLGDWTVPYNDGESKWTITKNVEGKSYNVAGFCNSKYPVVFDYDEATGGISVSTQLDLGTISHADGDITVGLYGTYNGTSLAVPAAGSSYVIFTGTQKDGKATFTPENANVSTYTGPFEAARLLGHQEATGKYYTLSGLAGQALPTSGSKNGGSDEGDGSASYKKFLGTWTVDSAFDVTFSKKTADKSFNLRGWQMEQNFFEPMEATFANDAVTLYGNDDTPFAENVDINAPEGACNLYYVGKFIYDDGKEYYITSGGYGAYDVATAKIGADGKMTFTGNDFELSNGSTYTFMRLEIIAVPISDPEGGVYTFKSQPGEFPLTAVKGGSTSSVKAMGMNSGKGSWAKSSIARVKAVNSVIGTELKAYPVADVTPVVYMKAKSVKALDLPATKSNIKVVLRKIKK